MAKKNSNAAARVALKTKLARFSWEIHYAWNWSPSNLIDKSLNEGFRVYSEDLVTLAKAVDKIVALFESIEIDVLGMEEELIKLSTEIKQIKNKDIGGIRFKGLTMEGEIEQRERQTNILQSNVIDLLNFNEVRNYRIYLRELANHYDQLDNPTTLVNSAQGHETAREIAKDFKDKFLEEYNIDLEAFLTSGARA